MSGGVLSGTLFILFAPRFDLRLFATWFRSTSVCGEYSGDKQRNGFGQSQWVVYLGREWNEAVQKSLKRLHHSRSVEALSEAIR
jgi:hypothetical protein